MNTQAEIPDRDHARSGGAPGRRLVSILEILFVGVSGIFLAVLAIPQWNGVETFCFLDGPEAPAADRYATWTLVIGLATWIAMIVATIFAFRLSRPTLGVFLPLAWFLSLLAVAAVVAYEIGPQPCQGSFF